MFRKLAPILFSAFTLWACAPTVDLRGKLAPPEAIAQIQVGKTTQEQVMSLLGSPSTIMTFGDETWHYIYQKVETVSFFTPKVTDSNTLTIVFDDKGLVKNISRAGMTDLKDVTLVSRETPTAGKELSVIEQLIGNVGKFAKDTKTK
jgi:outer membrane protein assembly factor BamE (lipoprotein component of BamABCDE complex)